MGKVRDIQKPNGRRHPGQQRMDFSAGASLWLQERTPEQLKGGDGCDF